MAGVGHLAVGMAAARLCRTESPARNASLAAVLFWSALSFLPDADVVGFAVGVRYGDEWGHRGATHSLVFAAAVGVAVAIAALFARRRPLRTGIGAGLVVSSHALLDTLTDGGLGCALFWPFDLTRYFAPWTPIPVSPIGLGILSPYGMYVIAVELLLFAPLIWFAWRPRLGPLVPVLVWLAALGSCSPAIPYASGSFASCCVTIPYSLRASLIGISIRSNEATRSRTCAPVSSAGGCGTEHLAFDAGVKDPPLCVTRYRYASAVA